MRRRCGTGLAVIAIAVVLGACAPGQVPDREPDTEPAQPPARTSWTLGHRIVESKSLRVVGRHIDQYEESTSVTLGPAADGADPGCFVTVSVPGSGGPDNMVGEKIPTRVRSRPGIRSGAGAEGAYLMWHLEDGRWVMVGCDHPDDYRSVDVVAAAVQLRPSSIAVPFGLKTLPVGYGLSIISQNLRSGSTSVYLGRMRTKLGGAEADLEISLEGRDPVHLPTGRQITIKGRPAMLNEAPRGPGVCIFVQEHYVCVTVYLSDTGDHPDRSDEIPTLIRIGEGLSYADNLDDRSTWLPAERVFE